MSIKKYKSSKVKKEAKVQQPSQVAFEKLQFRIHDPGDPSVGIWGYNQTIDINFHYEDYLEKEDFPEFVKELQNVFHKWLAPDGTIKRTK